MRPAGCQPDSRNWKCSNERGAEGEARVGEYDLYCIIRHRQRTMAANIRISPLLANVTGAPQSVSKPRIYPIPTLSILRNVSDNPTQLYSDHRHFQRIFEDSSFWHRIDYLSSRTGYWTHPAQRSNSTSPIFTVVEGPPYRTHSLD